MVKVLAVLLLSTGIPESMGAGRFRLKAQIDEPRYEAEVYCENGAKPALERRHAADAGQAFFLVCDAKDGGR